MDELLTTSQMQQADALTIARGTPSRVLMERAGQAVADAVAARFARHRKVIVLAGPGNNGGDGFVAARLLRDWGFDVCVQLAAEPGRLRGDAAAAAASYDGPVGEPRATGLDAAGVVIDALFGAGLDRPLEGPMAALIDAANNAGAPIVAVDLPSGVNGDTGQVMGCAIQAQATVTFFRRKPGHLLLPGRSLCGSVKVADIGIADDVLEQIGPRYFCNRPQAGWLASFPVPRSEGHKYTRGHVAVRSGPLESTGAARLAARAALRTGAGLVTLASPRDALPVNAAANLAVMVRPVDTPDEWTSFLADSRINVIVLGPGGGLGAPMRGAVAQALQRGGCLVLDADALTSFGENPKELFTLLANHRLSTAILTPHEGEFARLFSLIDKIPSVKQKLEAGLAASHETGAILLLKGPDSVVCAPDGRAVIAENAPAYLATAGSGDVLAGIVAGLCAQGMPAFEATAAAVWIHGEAAREFGPGLISEDLPEVLPAVYRLLFDLVERHAGMHA